MKLLQHLIKHYTVKIYRGVVDVQLHTFLTSALDGDEWSVSHLSHFMPKQRAPGTHWIRGWVGPRAGLDVVENRNPSVPAWNQTMG
jgi:hypothetical protein